MLVSFNDAVKRLLRFVETCPELRKEFDSPRYYSTAYQPEFFNPDNEPRELTQEQLTEKGKCFLRGLIGPEDSSHVFVAFKPDGGKHWILRSSEKELLYCEGNGSRATRKVEDSAIFLSHVELDVFFGLAAPGRRLLLDWEAASRLAGERPESLWKYVLRGKEGPPQFPNRLGIYRGELANDLLPAQMIGRLKLYSWGAVRAWADKKGIPAPLADTCTGNEVFSKFLSLDQAEGILAERFGTTKEDIVHEIAAWVFHRELIAYTDIDELGDERRFYFTEADLWRKSNGFDSDKPYDYLAPLEACFFKNSDITRFQPINRYITGAALIARWKAQRGSEAQAKAFVKSRIEESRLDVFHPIYAGSDVEDVIPKEPGELSLPPIEECLVSLNEAREVEAVDFGKSTQADTLELKDAKAGTDPQDTTHPIVEINDGNYWAGIITRLAKEIVGSERRELSQDNLWKKLTLYQPPYGRTLYEPPEKGQRRDKATITHKWDSGATESLNFGAFRGRYRDYFEKTKSGSQED
jgi:hypothetical protein